MAQPVFLSVIIPAFDEAERITGSLGAICDYLKGRPFASEVIVVDDGSTDDTTSLVKNFNKDPNPVLRVIENHANRGKGYSVRQGVAVSLGEFIIFIDADLCCPVEEMAKFLDLLQGGKDVVVGSRAVRGAKLAVRQPWWREMMGRCFNLFVQLAVLPGIWDTQCGFKGFRGAVAREIFSLASIDRFGFDVEILLLARCRGYKITEVGVAWKHSFPSKVNPVRDSLRMLIELFRIKINFLRNANKVFKKQG